MKYKELITESEKFCKKCNTNEVYIDTGKCYHCSKTKREVNMELVNKRRKIRKLKDQRRIEKEYSTGGGYGL